MGTTVEQWESDGTLIKVLRAIRNPGDELEGFFHFYARLRAAEMIAVLNETGGIRGHNVEGHAKKIEFEPETIDQIDFVDCKRRMSRLCFTAYNGLDRAQTSHQGVDRRDHQTERTERYRAPGHPGEGN